MNLRGRFKSKKLKIDIGWSGDRAKDRLIKLELDIEIG